MTAPGPGPALLERLAVFARVLRLAGLQIGPARLIGAVEALDAVDLALRDDVYWALRSSFVGSADEIEVFDVAFAAFWERRSTGARIPRVPESDRDEGGDAGALGQRRRLAPDEQPAAAAGDDESERARIASPHERLGSLDLREYGEDELREARAVLERLARVMPLRRSRRLRAAHAGRRLDEHRTLRDSIRTGGHPVVRRWRQPKRVPRRLVFLLDVSGSMEPYARAMVVFLQAAVSAGRSVEAFTFGTRLTRLTPHLPGRDPSRALARAAQAVPDWAGGTRIGENLEAFNDLWGRRSVTRGAIVTIVSDGWERGDIGLLSREMARLRRTSHTLVWVNPLTGDPDFAPLAAGMAAALAHVDLFLPGHDLRSLTALLDDLEEIADGPRHAGRAPAGSGAATTTSDGGRA